MNLNLGKISPWNYFSTVAWEQIRSNLGIKSAQTNIAQKNLLILLIMIFKCWWWEVVGGNGSWRNSCLRAGSEGYEMLSFDSFLKWFDRVE